MRGLTRPASTILLAAALLGYNSPFGDWVAAEWHGCIFCEMLVNQLSTFSFVK